MSSIELVHLTKRYGKTVAVDDLNLNIKAGDFLTLLGPSGCGKTTALRMIAGLEEPDAGEIVIDGRTVYSYDEGIFVPPAQRGIGLVFQSYALWPHMTVFQNIAFGLELAHYPRTQIQPRVLEILEDLQMSGLEERYPQEMSGGQQQRVALARMLAPKPTIFLLDEPLSNLDARLRIDMRSELKRLHRDTGATTVYVTHDQLEALTMSSEIAVMRAGKLQQLGSPAEVYKLPTNLFVADFIGNPKINLLDAQAVPAEDGTSLKLDSFEIRGVQTLAHGDLVAAIRPEDIHLSLAPSPQAVECRVYSVLPAGSEVIINVLRPSPSRERQGLMLTIKETHALDVEMDACVWVTFDPSTINLYNKQTGAILPNTSSR